MSDLAHFERSGVSWLHLDVMDGHYVNNFGLGPDFCRSVEKVCRIPQDVHLMVEEPERHISLFANLRGARIGFHPETTRHPAQLIAQIQKHGCSACIVVSPAVTIESLRHLIPLVQQVTVMTVNPGFAGQSLLPWCLQKISQVCECAETLNPTLDVCVDGNVSWANMGAMKEAGANVFVLGTSSLFQSEFDRSEALSRLKMVLGI